MKTAAEELRRRDPFLSDPDNLHYEIWCVGCSRPLWRTRVLKRDGSRVVSTETLPCEPVVPKFDRRMEWCPLCGRRFYAHAKSGGHMYMIKDLACGLKRLI